MPVLDDGRVVETASIVWCTGFQQRFDWVKLPIFDERRLADANTAASSSRPPVCTSAA